MTPKFRVMCVTLLFAIPIDALTKRWVESSVALGERVGIIEGFLYITHARNSGAAFGLFQNAPADWRLVAFSTVSALAIAMIFSFYRQLAPGDRRTAAALALILGGAVGNFLDRALKGEVVDFLHISLWGGFVWPDFNLADAFIVVGVLGLILDLLASEALTRSRTEEEIAISDDK